MGVAMPFCELHAPRTGVAWVKMYETDTCERLERTIVLTTVTLILDSDWCFRLDNQNFCARSFGEKLVWMGRLSSVQLELLFDAPYPIAQDFWHWRDAEAPPLPDLSSQGDVRYRGRI